MSSSTQNRDPSYNTPLPRNPGPIFQRNRARRAKVSAELEALREAFLEYPTLEGLEAFVEKKTEFNTTMKETIDDCNAITYELIVYVRARERATARAKERRYQEFQRALERMDPVEAEAAQRAESARRLRVQRENEILAAALDIRIARVRAAVREKYS